MVQGISDYPLRHGIVYGFSGGERELTEAVVRDLSLRRPIEFWIWVSQSYRELKMGEPTVDALIMLDLLSCGVSPSLPLRIGELECGDEIQMRTYSDLISKLYDTYYGTKGPLELKRLLSVARDYLACCGVAPKRPRVFVSQKGDSVKKAMEVGCRAVERWAVGDVDIAYGGEIRALVRQGRPGNTVCILRSADGFVRRTQSEDFLMSEELSDRILKVRYQEESLLSCLLEFSDGLEIKLSDSIEAIYPLAEILCDRSGNYLAEIAQEDMIELQIKAREQGLDLSPVATVKKGKGVSVICRGVTQEFNADFLRAVLNGGAGEEIFSASAEPLSRPSFHMYKFLGGCNGDVCLADGYLTGCAYYDGATAVVGSVSMAVARGADLRDISTANLISVDRKESRSNMLSNLISYLLGIYRAQIELCVPDAGCDVETADRSGVSSVAFCEGGVIEPPVSRGYLYYLCPALSNEGFPDYGDLRRSFRFVSGAVRTGRCRAAAVGTRGLSAAVRELCGDGFEGELPEASAIPGGFLLLCEERIQGLECFGTFNM